MQKKSMEVIAYETANGMYGVGKERERNLRMLGYNPNRVQKLVNRYMRYGFPVGLSEKAKRYVYASKNPILGESKDEVEEMLGKLDAGTSLTQEEIKDIIKYVNEPEDIGDVLKMMDTSNPSLVDLMQDIKEKAPQSFQNGITTPKKLGDIVDYCKENEYTDEEILEILNSELDGVPTEEGKEAERVAKEKDANGNGIPDSIERLNQEIDNTDEVPVPDGAVTGDNSQANKVPVSYNYPNGTNNPNPNNLITCYIRNMITDEVIKFPTIPTELSESYQTNYSSTDINGRSAPYQTYGGNAARSLNYNVKLYEDLCAGEYGSMGDIVRKLKSLVYPRYNGSIVIPPYCFLKFGDMVTCYAIMESISFSWGEVILEGKGNFASCDVDFSFQELRVDKIPTADTVFPDREA